MKFIFSSNNGSVLYLRFGRILRFPRTRPASSATDGKRSIFFRSDGI